MALTRRLDGNQANNLVTSDWWNTYYDLLTGAMTDQPVTIANTVTATKQGSTSQNTPLMSLKTTVSAAHQYSLYISAAAEYGVWDDTANTKVFTATPTELKVPGKVTWNKTLAGASQQVLQMTPTDAGAKNIALNYNPDNSIALYNYTDSVTMLNLTPAGLLSVGGTPVPVMTNKWGARKLFVQDTLPTTGMVKGDLCIKTPFA